MREEVETSRLPSSLQSSSQYAFAPFSWTTTILALARFHHLLFIFFSGLMTIFGSDDMRYCICVIFALSFHFASFPTSERRLGVFSDEEEMEERRREKRVPNQRRSLYHLISPSASLFYFEILASTSIYYAFASSSFSPHTSDPFLLYQRIFSLA